ncbi:MAG TPA: hypothetical protein VN851_23390, partial [Thermoanaerobaculia bacterium]|nr:hypothetical protein [Thermoanaerobaculia bacterium]
IFFVRDTPATGSEVWTSDGTPGGTRLVKDLTPGPAGSGPMRLIWSSNRLWFFALGGLWTSNGTAAGTRRIATVGTGEIRAVGAVGTRLLYFAAATPNAEVKLWASDGTAAGTRTLGIAVPANHPIEPFTTAGANAYFTKIKDDGQVFEREVWVTDGTAARTRKLASFGFYNFSLPLVAVGSRVAFVAGDDAHGLELWSSDGTAGGTRGIDVCSGSCSGVDQIGAADGGRVWFAGTRPGEGAELWTSDLSAGGTRLVKDLAPGGSSSLPELFLAGGGKVFFSTRPTFSTDELWTSDGTAAGTRRLVQRVDEDNRLGLVLGAIVGGRAFLTLDDEVHGNEPWVTDGTPVGTRLIADLDPNQDGGSFPQVLRPGGGRCYFLANFDRLGSATELWSSDGTAAGTVFAHRFDDSQISSAIFVASADLGSRIALIAGTGFKFAEIWISDGTEGGTFRLDNVDLRPTGKFRAIGNRLFFEAVDQDHAAELWTTDGTAAGTVRLTDFANTFPFPDENQNDAFRALGSRLVFLAADPLGRLEPWLSDGTIGGTRRLAEVYPALVASFFELSSEIVEAGGKHFYVSGEESEVGTEPALWVTDLTAGGTHKVGALRDSGGNISFETGLFALGGRALLFYHSTFENGFWSSDGSSLVFGAQGAGRGFGSNGLEPRLWNGRLVYPGEDDRLYATDGTAAGTEKFHYPEGTDVFPVAFAVLGDRLAFSAFDGIWDTDGTPQGTARRVTPRDNSPITEFLRVGERIFFPGYDAATGTELWALRP